MGSGVDSVQEEDNDQALKTKDKSKKIKVIPRHRVAECNTVSYPFFAKQRGSR
jgi:hypothetical protein